MTDYSAAIGAMFLIATVLTVAVLVVLSRPSDLAPLKR
jgi:hypothetical protein